MDSKFLKKVALYAVVGAVLGSIVPVTATTIYYWKKTEIEELIQENLVDERSGLFDIIKKDPLYHGSFSEDNNSGKSLYLQLINKIL